jgi:hypothetical protein
MDIWRPPKRFVAARRRSGALLLSMMSLFGFENPKIAQAHIQERTPTMRQSPSNKLTAIKSTSFA